MLVACQIDWLCVPRIFSHPLRHVLIRPSWLFVTANSLIGSAIFRGLFNLRYNTVSDLGCRPLESRFIVIVLDVDDNCSAQHDPLPRV